MVPRLIAVAGAAALLAAPAAAQHEFGVDLVVASSKVDLPNADRVLQIGTPVDVRIGMGGGPLSFETRFSLAYASSDGNSVLAFDPGLNLLYSLGGSSRQGLYLTGGGKIHVMRVSGDDDSETQTQLGMNVGLGTRMPMGAAAMRIEGFYAMMLEKEGEIPASNSIGVRVGFSFWK